ncbi:hypothetical protein VNO78_27044 [Psophocarpus tetragonolobus]|uniref:Uncharacterized protein n=1 Tax=Psophocarpus tetragonolobus TaxID=3891 RepID=A0AAN9S2S0_PSOTE
MKNLPAFSLAKRNPRHRVTLSRRRHRRSADHRRPRIAGAARWGLATLIIFEAHHHKTPNKVYELDHGFFQFLILYNHKPQHHSSLSSSAFPIPRTKFSSKMGGTQSEREEKVSLELSEEILQSMEVGMAFKDYNGRISSLDFHRASSYLVTASDDESIRLYEVTSGTCLKTINSKKYGVDLVCFTSHPTTVIYSSKNGWDESLRLLSLHDNKYLRYFKGHHDRVVSLSLCSRKDCFISGSLDRTVLLWDQRAEKCQGLLHVQGRPAISYDDQGLVFAIAFGGYIRMFDARKYEKGPFEIFSVGGDISDANVVKFSNDGRLMLLTTADGHIHVLDSFRGTLLSTYNVIPVSCNSTLEASFSPEGMFVISSSGDGSIYAWSVRSGKEVACWRSATSDTGPPVIKWAPGSLMFVTGSSELSFWIPDLSKLGSYVGRK